MTDEEIKLELEAIRARAQRRLEIGFPDDAVLNLITAEIGDVIAKIVVAKAASKALLETIPPIAQDQPDHMTRSER